MHGCACAHAHARRVTQTRTVLGGFASSLNLEESFSVLKICSQLPFSSPHPAIPLLSSAQEEIEAKKDFPHPLLLTQN